MKNQDQNFHPSQTLDHKLERNSREKSESTFSYSAPGDARDILVRLYREIGISAVAAALQAIEPKTKIESEDSKRQTQRRFTGYAA